MCGGQVLGAAQEESLPKEHAAVNGPRLPPTHLPLPLPLSPSLSLSRPSSSVSARPVFPHLLLLPRPLLSAAR
eukprot:1124360-Rhodomonas_salina.1